MSRFDDEPDSLFPVVVRSTMPFLYRLVDNERIKVKSEQCLRRRYREDVDVVEEEKRETERVQVDSEWYRLALLRVWGEGG